MMKVLTFQAVVMMIGCAYVSGKQAQLQGDGEWACWGCFLLMMGLCGRERWKWDPCGELTGGGCCSIIVGSDSL